MDLSVCGSEAPKCSPPRSERFKNINNRKTAIIVTFVS